MAELRAVGITCGIGSMLVGARQAGFRVVGNVEWRKYYRERDAQNRNTFLENFADATLHETIDGLELSQIERLMGADLALGHPECLPGETRIFTSKGWKPIKNVCVGQKVLTHTGKFQPVIQVIKKDFSGVMLHLRTLTGSGSNGTLSITPDHPVLVGQRWIRAGDVKMGDAIRVLSSRCQRCSNLIPVWRDGSYCSISCAVEAQWEKATPEKRKQLVEKAHKATRRRCRDKTHQFYDPSVRSRLMQSLSLKSKGRTWIEKKMEWALKEVGLDPIAQHPIGKYFVDFALPDERIAVECDGFFWHRDKDRERIRDEVIKGEGWSILHFRDIEIQSDVLSCANEVKRISLNHSGKYEFIDVVVKKIDSSPKDRNRKVYNLSVLDDNSYIAKGFVVKNCGNFSQLSGANRDRKEKLLDPADIPLFVDLVARLKPRFFVMDDLPRSFMAYPMAKYAEALPDYDLFPEWVSNWGYGNVQKGRNRMFMLGALKAEKWTFVPGEQKHQQNVRDAIGDLPEPRAGSNVPNQDPHDNALDCFRALNLGGYRKKNTWGEVRDHFRDKRGGYTLEYERVDGSRVKRIGFLKGHWSGPSHVLTGGNAILHNLRCEPYTIRERARIQGFPDDFVFYGTVVNDRGEWNHDTSPHMVKQTGKAMPVQFCRYVSRQVAAHIRGEAFESSCQRVIPANEHVDQAKQWYCQNVGYAAQEAACGACWMAQHCAIRVETYGYPPLSTRRSTRRAEERSVVPAADPPTLHSTGSAEESPADASLQELSPIAAAGDAKSRGRCRDNKTGTHKKIQTRILNFGG